MQVGRYGKVNKCITFLEMLDMVPFMTRTGDAPLLYMLYVVVVHLDTLNASFSANYISYVKDLCGNWFRIDDSEIHRVPMSQVMSEGAYMLFYMRTNPRDHNRDAQERHYQSRSEMKPISHSNPGSEAASCSDWYLLFISSDKASFTTESTRDPFNTIDYSDGCHSIFNNVYPSLQNTVACRMFSGSKSQTRYFLEETSQCNNVIDSSSEDYYRRMYETNPKYDISVRIETGSRFVRENITRAPKRFLSYTGLVISVLSGSIVSSLCKIVIFKTNS